jgi:hypothetical protein
VIKRARNIHAKTQRKQSRKEDKPAFPKKAPSCKGAKKLPHTERGSRMTAPAIFESEVSAERALSIVTGRAALI